MAGPSFLLFDFLVDPALPRQCCSGRHRSTMAQPGDLVVLPAAYAPSIIESYGDQLKPITGAMLAAVEKACGVSDVAGLADLPHADLQAGRPALTPAPKKAPAKKRAASKKKTTTTDEAEPKG